MHIASSDVVQESQSPEQPHERLGGISVVIPVYRSAAILPDLYARLVVAVAAITDTFEILLVEDGGRDDSWKVIQSFAAQDAHVRGVRLNRNYGQHNALLCGIRLAKFEVIVTMDDDLQNPPEEIALLVGRLGPDADVVYGTPDHQRHGFLRDQSSRITKWALEGAMGSEAARHVSTFRAFDTYLRESFASYRGPSVAIDVLLTWGTTRFAHVKVRHEVRRSGHSNYTARMLFTHAWNMITGFSTIPLQVASLVGFVFTAFGLVVLAYVLISYVLNSGSVPGFAFLASIVAIFSGAQLFALGIIGEYIARIHFRTMDRTAYLVRERTDEPPQG